MKANTRITLTTLGIVVLVVGGIAYLKRPKPVQVNVAGVERGVVEDTVTNTRAGTIKSCERARLAPPTGGQVARLLVQKGEKVAKGQPLLELWNEDLKANLALARSEASAAKARTEQACLQAAIAKRDLARIKRLHEQHLASDENLDKADTAQKTQAAACDAARAEQGVAKDRVALAQAQFDRSILTAPFAGTVAEITGEPGEFVTPSPPGIPTPPAIDLIDPNCLYVSAPIDEVDAPKVEPCQEARVTLDAFGKRQFKAHVSRIAPYVLDQEKQARTVEVDAVFEDPADTADLMPGYSADLEIILKRHPDVLRIPTEAVIDGNHVYVLDPQTHTLATRKIKTGLKNWQYTEVTEGLREGEQVVTSVGRQGVREGAPAVAEPATP